MLGSLGPQQWVAVMDIPIESLDKDPVQREHETMQAVTIREAKARLNALIEAAERGEQVVLMRGARHVALIVPLGAEDLEVAPRLSDGQAERLWREVAAESRHGAGLVMESLDEAVAYLARAPKGRPRAEAAGKRRNRRRR